MDLERSEVRVMAEETVTRRLAAGLPEDPDGDRVKYYDSVNNVRTQGEVTSGRCWWQPTRIPGMGKRTQANRSWLTRPDRSERDGKHQEHAIEH